MPFKLQQFLSTTSLHFCCHPTSPKIHCVTPPPVSSCISCGSYKMPPSSGCVKGRVYMGLGRVVGQTKQMEVRRKGNLSFGVKQEGLYGTSILTRLEAYHVTTHAPRTCPWLVSYACKQLLHSTLVGEAKGGCFLPEGGHVIGAWQISKGYITTEKTTSGCEKQLVSTWYLDIFKIKQDQQHFQIALF